MRNQVECDDALAPRIDELNREFRTLLGKARSGLDSKKVNDIKIIIKAAFTNSSRCTPKCIEDLEKVKTINDIMHFLLTENICNYFNFGLLAVFIKKHGDVVCKQELEAYEQKFHEFAKTAKLLQLIKFYENFNPHQVLGFPVKVIYTMETERWSDNTLNTFLEITSHYLPSIGGIMSSIFKKSIVIIYSVFPEAVDNVKRSRTEQKFFTRFRNYYYTSLLRGQHTSKAFKISKYILIISKDMYVHIIFSIVIFRIPLNNRSHQSLQGMLIEVNTIWI